MALKPSDMTPPEEFANYDFVSRLETEMNDWLLTQEKGKRGANTFHQSISMNLLIDMKKPDGT
jgi:hypothetical protein